MTRGAALAHFALPIAKFVDMAVRRRPYGSLKHPTMLGYMVERTTKEKFDAVAELADVSSSELIETLMLRMLASDLTDQGIPSWMPEKDRSGELPIDGP